jgi:RNA polymerase sigma-70 factor (ECF subfamily)
MVAEWAREMSVEELAKMAASGDDRALDRLLRQVAPDVLRRCSAILLHRDDAEEACQDVMVRVARGIGRFEGRSKFTTWLYPIVTNCVRQTYRSLKKRQPENGTAELPVDVPDSRRTSVIAGARIDLLEALERLEKRMPDAVEPFVLRDLADLDYHEITQRLGLPESTLRFRTHEARKFVRQHLRERTSPI